ncbi:hypothetical protein GOP47_0006953 [Adiantum capillus-veneris]|uniref:DDE Tnp4 domain-containing protein n=1 Tax=Adiantum capillus-veneris TaxID=13818 RepID=A0A9D4V009_ADICA|nr:hypothetical protein GOP47_0006953 [Adiantum capillus-veneris]
MPSAKRAKLSHASPQESRASSEERLGAYGGEAGDEDAEKEDDDEDEEEAEPDDIEVEEEEEIIEESEEEEGKIDDEERGHSDGLDEDVEVEDDEVDQGEIEEVEEEEEIEEVVVEEEEEEEEEEEREAGGEDEEGEQDSEEEDEEGGGSEVESMEEDAESIDIGVANLTEPDGDGDADYQAARNGGGDVDDADEENEVSVTQHNNHLDDDDDDNDNEEEDDDDGEDDYDDDESSSGKQVGCEDEGDEEDERRKQLAVFMCISSMQTLMAMELCRDTMSPFDEITREDSTMLPVAFLKLVVLAVTSLMHEEGRQYWKLQRPGQEWAHIERGVGSIDSATRDSIWRRKYSMSYACFLYLVEELRPFIQSEAHIYVKAPLEIERAVAMVLYRLAHGLSAREVAEKYNVGASTVGKYTLIVASALSEANKLYGRYVAIPTGERMARIICQFQQMTNVSQMCGAIDGTHIKLYFKPDKWYGSSAYESPPKSHSNLLQAVCDANKLFWDVCCMAPGGAHEAAHFVTSNLYQKVKDGLSLQEPLATLENREVAPFMVGDSAYPLRPFMIKPFDTDDALRKAFDEQLRKGLACIDSAFAILKARWRILKCMNVHLMHAPRVAVACCVLHNICQLWGEPEPPHEQLEQRVNEQSQGSAAVYEIDEAARMAGEAAREALFRDWVKRSLDSPYVSFDQENMSTGQS